MGVSGIVVINNCPFHVISRWFQGLILLLPQPGAQRVETEHWGLQRGQIPPWGFILFSQHQTIWRHFTSHDHITYVWWENHASLGGCFHGPLRHPSSCEQKKKHHLVDVFHVSRCFAWAQKQLKRRRWRRDLWKGNQDWKRNLLQTKIVVEFRLPKWASKVTVEDVIIVSRCFK